MSEDQPVNSDSGNTENDAQKRRRRRGGRGGRGRGRRPPTDAVKTSSTKATASEGPSEGARASVAQEGVPDAAEGQLEVRGAVEAAELTTDLAAEQPPKPTLPPKPSPSGTQSRRVDARPQPIPRPPAKTSIQSNDSSAIAEAIEDVYRVTEALKKVLEDLDQLLETLELAERQKIEDERELDNLRRALRQLQQRPVTPHPYPAQHSSPRHSGRHQERQPQSPRAQPTVKPEITEPSPEDPEEPRQS